MRIAVTGGSGFVGARLIKKLVDRGYEVTNIDIKEADEKRNVTYKAADITNLEEVKSVLRNVDVVYHLAGFVLEVVRSKPLEGVHVNVGGTANVLEACRLNGIEKILFASSFYVYDGIDDKLRVNEETTLNGSKMELFGLTKLIGERMIEGCAKKYGLKYVIFRFGSIYGPGNCTNIVRTFIETAWKGETFEVWGEGKRINQYTFVDDIAEGCVLGLNKVNEIYNLISPEQTSIRQLADLMKRKYGFKAFFNKNRAEGASMPYMSSEKAIKGLGWKPISLEQGAEKTVKEMETTLLPRSLAISK